MEFSGSGSCGTHTSSHCRVLLSFDVLSSVIATKSQSSENFRFLSLEAGVPGDASEFFSVVALGSQDATVSIWKSSTDRPLLVLHDCFDGAAYCSVRVDCE